METLTSIDRKAYEPAYVQLANIIRSQIASGLFKSNTKLPSEAQLCSQYNVSPMTVRRTINNLIKQGVVSTIQGKGTFVKSIELETSSFHLEELLRLFRDKEKTKVKLLEVRILPADENVSQNLSIPTGNNVIFIRRLLSLNGGNPVLLHQGYLIYDPTRPVVESEMDVTALGSLLSGMGKSDLKKGLLTVHATVLNDKDGILLKVPAGTPALRLEHTFYDFHDLPVSWGWFICRGDFFRFTSQVGIWD
jgi:DNA-binding GntR family transcriptional regulator